MIEIYTKRLNNELQYDKYLNVEHSMEFHRLTYKQQKSYALFIAYIILLNIKLCLF